VTIEMGLIRRKGQSTCFGSVELDRLAEGADLACHSCQQLWSEILRYAGVEGCVALDLVS